MLSFTNVSLREDHLSVKCKKSNQTFSYLLGFYIIKHYKQHTIKSESEEDCKSRHTFITTLTEGSLPNATYREIFSIIVW